MADTTDVHIQPPPMVDADEDEFPAPPAGTILMTMLTQRQRRRMRDKAKKAAIAKASVQENEALKELLHLRLTEKREVRTGVTRSKARKMVAETNLDVRPGDDVATIARRMGLDDPALLQQLRGKNFTAEMMAKMQAQVAGMDPVVLASAVAALKAAT
jgi:hypothetical protein